MRTDRIIRCATAVVVFDLDVSIRLQQYLHSLNIAPEYRPHQRCAAAETEVPYLSSYSRKAKTKKLAAAELAFLDFVVEEQDADVYKALFHIELKAGPGSVDEMGEFQLDINDSNDIIGAVVKTGLPAYIVHVQLDHEYRPPTRRTVPKGLWFTDIFALLENRLSVKVRRGEDKQAGYYRPSAFCPIGEFMDVLKTRHYEGLTKLVADHTLKMT
jgi:hypothetical protein